MANARRRTQRPTRTATRMTARTSAVGSPTATLESAEVRNARMVDWQKETFYINKDLRELLIITVILFVLLFVVGFFI